MSAVAKMDRIPIGTPCLLVGADNYYDAIGQMTEIVGILPLRCWLVWPTYAFPLWEGYVIPCTCGQHRFHYCERRHLLPIIPDDSTREEEECSRRGVVA